MRRNDIDLARGFTVFIMTPVHAVLIYSSLKVHHSWLGHWLAFFAEGPGAPLFMMVMGISLVLTKNYGFKKILKKSLQLAALAYALNFMKFIVPLALGIIPEKLLLDNGISTGAAAYGELLLVGDILQMAACALPVIALVRRLRHYWYWAAVLAFVVVVISPFLRGITSSNPALNYFMSLLWGNGQQVYFPVFPWLAYPLAGLTVGHAITKVPGGYRKIGFAGCKLVIVGFLLSFLWPSFNEGSFYKQGPGAVLYHAGFVMIWLCGCRLLVKINATNLFFKLLFWLSKRITIVYLVQWILIFWLMGIFGYRNLNMAGSIAAILLLTPIVFVISRTLSRPNQSIHSIQLK